MKALVTGAGGQLGSDLLDILPGAAARTREELSILDPDSFEKVLLAVGADTVFNCAAYNAVDRAESEPEVAMRVNGEAPGLLAEVCLKNRVRFVHFSTNFVFDGAADAPYGESDSPRPLSAYAQSKLEGERRVLRAMPQAMVIRSAGLFGARGSAVKGGSFPERILRRARKGEPVRVVDDQRLNPTWTRHLAEAAAALAATQLSGVVHVVAAGCCTWLELAQAALELAGLDAEAEPISSSQLSAAAPRPANGCLRSERVAPLPGWREGLRGWFEACSGVV